MYKSKTICEKEFVLESEIDNEKYLMSLNKKNGTTPMGVLNVALSGCVTLCVRGYFFKKGMRDLVINVENVYDDEHFDINIEIDYTLNEIEKKELLAYIKNNCTVSKMLKEEVTIDILVNKEKI